MSPESARAKRRLRLAVVATLIVGAAYLVFRLVIPGTWALVASQVLYLSAPLAASALAVRAARTVPATHGEPRTWWAIAVAMALLFVNEIGYAVRILSASRLSGPVGGITDLAAAAATLIFIALVTVGPATDRRGFAESLRALSEMAALGLLTFLAIFRFVVTPASGFVESVQVAEGVRVAAYAGLGVFLIAGGVLNIRQLDPIRPPLRSYVFWAIVMLALGVMLWPVWGLATATQAGAVWAQQATAVLYYASYCLAALAALARAEQPDAPFRLSHATTAQTRLSRRLAGITLVLGTTVVLAVAAHLSAPGSLDMFVYLVALLVATILMVARAAVGAAEVTELRALAGTDGVTGVYNRERFQERLAEFEAAMRRFGEQFMVAVLDIDDLAAVNRAHGESAGDAVLAAVAGKLTSVVGSEAVFRVAGDKFAVITPVESEREASSRAGLLLAAVQQARVGDVRVSASVGYTVGGGPLTQDRDLVAEASEAELWSKLHGKGKATAYAPELMSRMLTGEGDSWISMADEPVVRGLLSLASAGSADGYRHSRNVSVLTAHFARTLGLDEALCVRLGLAAALHDVGKIAVRDVPDSERTHRSAIAAMRDHPVLGARMVEALDVEGIPQCVRSHHERWDGAGYPDALVAEDIPIGARILALADAYENMTASGARRSMSKAAALQEIDQGLGSKFDPTIGERFIALVATSEPLGWRDERHLEAVMGS